MKDTIDQQTRMVYLCNPGQPDRYHYSGCGTPKPLSAMWLPAPSSCWTKPTPNPVMSLLYDPAGERFPQPGRREDLPKICGMAEPDPGSPSRIRRRSNKSMTSQPGPTRARVPWRWRALLPVSTTKPSAHSAKPKIKGSQFSIKP